LDFKGRNIVSIKEFTTKEIEEILDVAEMMVPYAKGEMTSRLLDGHILATLFFEPSTRTNLSFRSAMMRLGGTVLGFSDTAGTSVQKGETLVDTIKMAEAYADVIVLRHPQEGAARLAAEHSAKPVINAGDGAGQHPTQTLLDLFTIRSEKKRISGLNVMLNGDLRYGRTVHSLCYALAEFGVDLTFVAPPTLQIPKEIMTDLKEKKVNVSVYDTMEEAIGTADVLYITRIQKERFPDPTEYAKVAGLYRVDVPLLAKAKKDMIVMHPLPRVSEIATEVDRTNHAVYFRQAFNGVPIRMALLALVLGADLKKMGATGGGGGR